MTSRIASVKQDPCGRSGGAPIHTYITYITYIGLAVHPLAPHPRVSSTQVQFAEPGSKIRNQVNF